MPKKTTSKKSFKDYVENQGEGGAVFTKNGKVVLDTRPKKGGAGGKKK